MKFLLYSTLLVCFAACQSAIGDADIQPSSDSELSATNTFSIFDPATGTTSKVVWSVEEERIVYDDRPTIESEGTLESRGLEVRGTRVGDVTGSDTGRSIKCISNPDKLCGYLAYPNDLGE